jgi:hypothetical protein
MIKVQLEEKIFTPSDVTSQYYVGCELPNGDKAFMVKLETDYYIMVDANEDIRESEFRRYPTIKELVTTILKYPNMNVVVTKDYREFKYWLQS